MHGVAENSDAWYGWIPHLSRRYRVLRFDVRGFGRSSPMPRDYDWPFEQIGDDLLALTRHLGIERFHLVSAKVGGTMALHFASRGPDCLQSLAVLGTPVAPRPRRIPAIRRRRSTSMASATGRDTPCTIGSAALCLPKRRNGGRR